MYIVKKCKIHLYSLRNRTENRKSHQRLDYLPTSKARTNKFNIF